MAAPKGNQYGKGNPNAGRRPKVDSPRWVAQCFANYFERQDEQQRPYTITGLARSVGMTRKQLIEYQNRDDFRNVITDAKARIIEQVEEKLVSAKGNAGTIFWLKNVDGWADVQQIDVNDISELSKDQLIAKIKALGVVRSDKKAA